MNLSLRDAPVHASEGIQSFGVGPGSAPYVPICWSANGLGHGEKGCPQEAEATGGHHGKQWSRVHDVEDEDEKPVKMQHKITSIYTPCFLFIFFYFPYKF
jgi:hypothetical protein